MIFNVLRVRITFFDSLGGGEGGGQKKLLKFADSSGSPGCIYSFGFSYTGFSLFFPLK